MYQQRDAGIIYRRPIPWQHIKCVRTVIWPEHFVGKDGEFLLDVHCNNIQWLVDFIRAFRRSPCREDGVFYAETLSAKEMAWAREPFCCSA